jgi:hypothetical protein
MGKIILICGIALGAVLAGKHVGEAHVRPKIEARLSHFETAAWERGYRIGHDRSDATQKALDAAWAEGYTKSIEDMISTTGKLEAGE